MPTVDPMFRAIVAGGVSLVAPLVLGLVACGGSVGDLPAGSDAGTDAHRDGSPSDGASDANLADSPGEAGYLACMSASGQLDAALKTCQADTDCAIEQEETDCCGTILYVGVNTASVAQFGACEAFWASHFPGCGCAANKSATEDGKTTALGVDGGGPLVRCTDFTSNGGVCMTYTP